MVSGLLHLVLTADASGKVLMYEYYQGFENDEERPRSYYGQTNVLGHPLVEVCTLQVLSSTYSI